MIVNLFIRKLYWNFLGEALSCTCEKMANIVGPDLNPAENVMCDSNATKEMREANP